MRILIQQKWSKKLTSNTKFLKTGFTFLEILLVLTLVIVILGSVTPNFLNFFSKSQESEFKYLKSIIKILRNDAILKNNSYCIIFDLNNQKIMTSNENKSGECEENYLTKPKILKPHKISDELILQEASLAEKNLVTNRSSSDFLKVHINNSGFVTPFVLKFSLKNFSKSWEIKSKGIMGELYLSEQ